MFLWLLITWLIKGGLSKLSGVLSEISGGLLDLVYLWLTNQKCRITLKYGLRCLRPQLSDVDQPGA